jgi:hypothetical protein
MDRGRVARSIVDQRWHRPKAPERGGTLNGAWPPATLEHGSSSVGAQQREENTGNSSQASSGLGRSWRKVITGGAHLSARHGEARRRQSGRAPPTRGRLGREGELGWPRGRGPVGRGRAFSWGRKKEVGHGWAENQSCAQFK